MGKTGIQIAEEARLEKEKIRNARALKESELRMEEERVKRISNETAEQRDARILEEERIAKRNKEEKIQKQLESKDITIAISASLTEFAGDRTRFDSAEEIIIYLDNITVFFDRFMSDNNMSGKTRVIDRVELALMRFKTMLNMLVYLDKMNPMYGDFECKYNNYTKHLNEVKNYAAQQKKLSLIKRIIPFVILVIGIILLVLSGGEGNGFLFVGMILAQTPLWWWMYNFNKNKKKDIFSMRNRM